MELTVGYGSLENSFLILIIFVLNKHQKEHRKNMDSVCLRSNKWKNRKANEIDSARYLLE